MRNRGIGPVARNRSGAVEERRADGRDQLHVDRRPEGQREIPGTWRSGREATILTKHPLQPSDEEIARNPASRSAKLRGLEMK